MKYTGTDGKEYNIKLRKTSKKLKSKYHTQAYEILKQLYPLYSVYEETKLPGCRNSLYLDLFIPNLGLAIEVQGEQHYRFIPHFHQNIVGFAQAKARDREKIEWCEINNIQLIELIWNEDIEVWKKKLCL